MKQEKWTMRDGKDLAVRIWDNALNPKGVLQISHGMAEHTLRYDAFACFLNSAGYIVAASDQRAHGFTDPDSLGKVGEGDLFEQTVADEMEITQRLKKEFSLPVVFMGHSYGSFIGQRYLTYGAQNLAGIILMGSALMDGIMVNLGYKIAAARCKRGKANLAGQTFANLTFVSYDKKIKDGINGWLSRNLKEVGKYNTDPLCGFICSNGFYKYFFNGLKSIAKDDGNKIPKNIKMLIVSGGSDIVGANGKLVNKLHERYVGLGLTPTLKLFEGARHEILNETNADEVFMYVLQFINKCINIQHIA